MDHLLSSHEFRIADKGCRIARTGKIRILSEWPVGLQNLRVCWQDEGRGKNCGKREKCVRTKMSFRALGARTPASVGGELDLDTIRNVEIHNDDVYREHRQIYHYGCTHGADTAYLKAHATILAAYRRKRFLRRLISALRFRKRKKR